MFKNFTRKWACLADRLHSAKFSGTNKTNLNAWGANLNRTRTYPDQ